MIFKAVLGKGTMSTNTINVYRLVNKETDEIIDIPVEEIKDKMISGQLQITNLSIINNKLVETEKVTHIPINIPTESLYDWCVQEDEEGQRILEEFNSADNGYITAKDISYGSMLKYNFRCLICGKENLQTVNSKTKTFGRKCKYCSGKTGGKTLLEWSKTKGKFGQHILKEYIGGNNDIPADKIMQSKKIDAKFKCLKCGEITITKLYYKTRKNHTYCKFCDTDFTYDDNE